MLLTKAVSSRKSYLALISACAAATIALTGCGASGSPQAANAKPGSEVAVDPHAPEVSKIVGIQYRLENVLPFMAAADNGIAQEYGISLEPSYIESSPAALTALVGGSGQVATVSAWSVVDAVRQGMDIRVIGEAAGAVKDQITLEVLPGSSIKGIADLKGMKIGVTGLNSSQDGRLMYAMSKDGLDPAGPVFVALPFGEMASALQQGTIDAATVQGASQKTVRDTLKTRTIFDYTDGLFDGFPNIQWVANGDFVDKNPNSIAAFQCAVVKKGQELITKDDTTWKDLSRKYLGYDDAAIAAAVKGSFPATNDASKVQIIPDIMFELKRIDKEFDIAAISVPMPTNCA